jgi:hypothetical protein
LTQLWPAAQTLPQPPQLRGSTRTLTHTPLQRLVPPPQAQAPLTQDAPAPHTLPQDPQLLGSIATSVHTPLHRA